MCFLKCLRESLIKEDSRVYLEQQEDYLLKNPKYHVGKPFFL